MIAVVYDTGVVIKRADALGRRWCDVFRASICENACALKQTLSTSRRVVEPLICANKR